jgi:replicative DNA helicase
MILETKLLSKVLLERDFYTLSKYNILESDFTVHKDVYLYIKEFVKEYGQVPDYRDVVAKFPKFDFQVEVYDTFAYLCRALKKQNAKVRIFNVLQNQVGEKFRNEDIDEFLDWLYDEVTSIKNLAKTAISMGSNYAVNGMERKKRYLESKEKGSGIFIPTPYDTLTLYLDGGMELGDYVLLQAFSNKGKSWIASHMGAFAWTKGFGVLHYSPELSKAQQENRLDTLLGHFNNVAIRNGNLNNEDEYFEFLEKFTDNEVPYIIKTMEDLPDGLSLDVIEADLQLNSNIQMVIIDGFNLMVHGKGSALRNNMTITSRKLRQIFGRYQVVGLVVHQVNADAERNNHKEDENGQRLPNPPKITDYSETIAVIQDASTVLSFDAVDGMGAIEIVKARGTGKNKVVELNLNFNMGYITEASPVDYF